MITGVWHFSFTVSDLERSLAFYTGLLGMKLVHRQDQAGEYTRKLVGYRDADLRVALLGLEGAPSVPSGHVLELIQYRAPVCPPHPPGTAYPNSAHLAFVAEDARAEYERLRAAGVQFRSEPVAITSGINRGGYTVYFLDPDGITLELVQPPPRPKTSVRQWKVTSGASGSMVIRRPRAFSKRSLRLPADEAAGGFWQRGGQSVPKDRIRI